MRQRTADEIYKIVKDNDRSVYMKEVWNAAIEKAILQLKEYLENSLKSLK